ncbi:GNAT family N-acetyltransferase [Kitasatospora sp. NPDC101183]|uniref:GNAT family N-acetyltransferase n=1 Tax=Kitasatospora sp. NPDC101183 TaxID=3364100 RepID=UPI003813752B
MTIRTSTPTIDELPSLLRALAAWQHDDRTAQLHPGDLGWYWRFGTRRTAESLRTWSRSGVLLAVGLLDGPDVLRLEIAPEALHDDELTLRLAEGAADVASVATPADAPLRDQLLRDGWEPGEAWTPLRRDLTAPVPAPDARIETAGPEQAADRTAVQRAAFAGSTFTPERWHTMAAGAPYAAARCLLARDDHGRPVAAATVWSAGEGRPGLIEPMAVHADHRRLGHGRAVTLAAAHALRALGSSSAVVCTPSDNTAAVATYRSAGFQQLPDLRDLHRKA